MLPIAPGTGDDVVVLPDGRLRILASTDVDATATTQIDVAIVGLNPDGSPDAAYGTKIFPAAASGPDAPTSMALGPGGRLAVTGTAADGGNEDVFVALREADGSPAAGFGTAGVRVVDRGGPGLNDRGVDVAFRPGGGLLVLAQVETNPADDINDDEAVLHAFTSTAADDPGFGGTSDIVLPAGEPDTVPGGLLVDGDRIWATGTTRAGADVDAWIARLDADGAGFEVRRFDMRGTTVPAAGAVSSAGNDLAVVSGGSPVTGGPTGSIGYGARPYWAAAVFDDLDGPLASAGFGDLVIPTDEYGAIVGVAAGGAGWAAIAGVLVDVLSNLDTSFGTARLLIDTGRTCDLALQAVEPAEIAMPAGGRAPVAVTVASVGTQACSGGAVRARAVHTARHGDHAAARPGRDADDRRPGPRLRRPGARRRRRGPVPGDVRRRRRPGQRHEVRHGALPGHPDAHSHADAHADRSRPEPSDGGPGAAGRPPAQGDRRVRRAAARDALRPAPSPAARPAPATGLPGPAHHHRSQGQACGFADRGRAGRFADAPPAPARPLQGPGGRHARRRAGAPRQADVSRVLTAAGRASRRP